jgi:PD-(D/E)XK nuclease superfamily protein
MSLLRSLFRLAPSGTVSLEDFHTEIAAYVMRSLRDETLDWLREIRATSTTDPDDVIVTTQEELPALELHATGSRPDIAIRLAKNGERELIYIESKIGSAEGYQQLSRYLDHLEKRPEKGKTLVFITRSYEPKEIQPRAGVTFVQTRWSHFFRTFNQINPKRELLTELLKFMKEHNMSQSNKFTTIDLLAIRNFRDAQNLMDATMWESVHKRFVKFAGKMFWKESALTQLRKFYRYVMAAEFGPNQFELLLGYWADQDMLTDSPWVGVSWHINPNAPARRDIVAAMEEYVRSSAGKWEVFDLTDEKAWGGMCSGKDLTHFLGQEDHVKAISEFFDAVLGDVEQFQKRYPKLPWTPRGAQPNPGDREA